MAKKKLTKAKAKKILKDGKVRGKKLTAKQKKFMGWVAGGKKSKAGGQKPRRKKR